MKDLNDIKLPVVVELKNVKRGAKTTYSQHEYYADVYFNGKKVDRIVKEAMNTSDLVKKALKHLNKQIFFKK